jgi:hypothetical protein
MDLDNGAHLAGLLLRAVSVAAGLQFFYTDFMRGVHDMGGLQAGPVERVEHDYQLWEKRVDALMVLLSRKRRFTVDELRKGIESLPGDAYEKLTYYERWISSISQALIHRGTITIEEVRAKLADIEKRPDGPKAGKP